jgi:mannosylfructose-phosphate synthase
MITNHGVHEWRIILGLPDTGGQNVFVNQFAESLSTFGFKISIVNRGGYPHPFSGEMQRGVHYKDENQRIIFLDDGKNSFVRKEDMHEQVFDLAAALQDHLNSEGASIDLIFSHYWDGAKIGVIYNASLPAQVPHIWVPHSLGTLKKRNVEPKKWVDLRIDERIEAEREIIPRLNGAAATSSIIRITLRDDYGYSSPDLFLPPGVDTKRYHPRKVDDANPVWEFLSRRCGLSTEEIRHCKIISEISRTDTTKRKDVLIKAFSQVHQQHPDSLLVVSIDDKQTSLYKDLNALIDSSGAGSNIAVVGSIWDILPTLYAVTDIYCTPSVMEGFGMSAQEAAATGVPVVASHLVPYVVEYLLGTDPEKILPEGSQSTVQIGQGAILVQADNVDGFAYALELLLEDDALRNKIGENAYRATIPYFTWDNMVGQFLRLIDFGPR